MSGFCLLCNEDDKLLHPKGVDYVCSRCTQKLLAMDGPACQAALEKAESINAFGQVKAIKLFYRKGTV